MNTSDEYRMHKLLDNCILPLLKAQLEANELLLEIKQELRTLNKNLYKPPHKAHQPELPYHKPKYTA